MKITCLEIANFRRLKLVRLDMQPDTTVLVGANNSGKTSAMDALRKFLAGTPFALSDFSISSLPTIRAIGEEWERREQTASAGDAPTAGQDLEQWFEVSPTLDLWIEALENELHLAAELLPLLEEYPGVVGVRLRYQPRDVEALKRNYLRLRYEITRALESDPITEGEEKARLWPIDLADYLETELQASFELKLFKLDPALMSPALELSSSEWVGVQDGAHALQPLDADEEPLPLATLKRLLKVDFVGAQRELGGQSGSSRLSTQAAEFYERHLSPGRRHDAEDLAAIRTTQKAALAFDGQLAVLFKESLDEIAAMGYPGGGNPDVVIRTKLQLADGLRHDSVLRYRIPSDSPLPLEIPEGLNGLGYQNLVLMILSLISFRRSRLEPRRDLGQDDPSDVVPPLHLVLVEEPEAHLHAQVQQVFVKQAYLTLTSGGQASTLSTQLLLSTHSSHIAHQISFEQIRYFRRVPGTHNEVPTTVVENLTNLFGGNTDTERFVKRYVRLNHCNVFFADALVVVEGSAETLLVPHFVQAEFKTLEHSYVDYLEIGGAHAHRLRSLIEVLRVPTLVITDIDAKDSNGKVRPEVGQDHVTGNATLRKWLESPPAVDDLIQLEPAQKVLDVDGNQMVRFAFQTPIEVELNGVAASVIPSTFEDSLVLSNPALFAGMKGAGLARKIRKTLQDSGLHPSEAATNIYRHLQKGDKAEFALETLVQIPEMSGLVAPDYIRDGLAWLEDKATRLEIVGVGTTSASGTDA